MPTVNDYENEALDEEGEVEEPPQGLSEESRDAIRGGVRRGIDKYGKGKKEEKKDDGAEGENAEQPSEKGQAGAQQAPNSKKEVSSGGKSPVAQTGGSAPTPPPAKKAESEGAKNAGADATGGAGGAGKKTGGEGIKQLGNTLDRAGQAQQAARIGSDIAHNPEEAAKEAAKAAKDEAIRRAKEEAMRRAKEAAKKKIEQELAKRGLLEAVKMGGKQAITAVVGAVGWEVILIVLVVIIIIFIVVALLLLLLGIVVGVIIGSQSITSTGSDSTASVNSAYYADGSITGDPYGGGGSGGYDYKNAVVNGVVLYKQGSGAPWANYSYGRGTTVASSGCGPTSIAMVLATYGIDVTPDKIAQYSLDNGFRVFGSGTSWGIFKSIANHYGLGLREVGGSVSAVMNQLSQGYPAVVSVSGPSKFTSGGHFLVVTGYENGKFLFNDPGGRNVTESTVSELSSALRNAWVFLKPGGG